MFINKKTCKGFRWLFYISENRVITDKIIVCITILAVNKIKVY